MEADLDVMRHAERIAASPQCQSSACSLSGFRKFVIRFVMQDLFDECKLDWEALNSFLGYLDVIETRLLQHGVLLDT
jgi:hypothetical protein